MRFIAVAVFGGMLLLSGTARAEIVVIVSQSQQQLAVAIDDQELFRWKVSTGRRGYETPDGVFQAKSLNREWFSRQYDMTPMPWSVFFYQGYALHGTTEARNLGHPASHGCVRLDIDNATILFALVSEQGIENTKVMITERPLPPLRKAAPALIAEIERGAQAWIAAQTVQVGGEELQTKSADQSTLVAQAKAGDKAPADAAPQPVAPPPAVVPLPVVPVRAVPQPAASQPVAPPATIAIQDVKLAEPTRLDVPLPAPRTVPDKRQPGETSYATARGDEAQVLREREAWLRQLAHKYGYEHW